VFVGTKREIFFPLVEPGFRSNVWHDE